MATVYDVAEKAGFSIGTVSKVLNGKMGKQRFGRECIERIKKAADELGYKPHYHARSLMTGQAGAVGCLIGINDKTLWGDFIGTMVGGMIVESEKHRKHFVAVNCMPDMAKIESGLQFLEEKKIDALIVPSFSLRPGVMKKLEDCGYPVVIIGYPGETSLPVVDVDNSLGTEKLVRHLYELGHRKMVWIGPEKEKNGNPEPRLQKFRELTDRLEIKGEELLVEHLLGESPEARTGNIETARKAMSEFLETGPGITCVICYDERYSFGVSKALQKAGLSVPGDISVTGFNDLIAEFTTPSLTAVSLMLGEIGKKAVEIAVDIINDRNNMEKHKNERVLIEPDIIVRESTGAAPKKAGGSI